MTYQELIALLKKANIEAPEWDAALLLEHFCGASIGALDPNALIDYPQSELKAAAERRAAHEPLQYILGEWSFFRQVYEVSPACLIPRSDTEILVEEAIRLLPQNAFFADLCTGSGCIAISTLCERPDTRGYAVDKFADTLKLAARNAQKNGVADRLQLQKTDVLTEPIVPDSLRFDAILSNPPYIPTSAIAKLAPELAAEPRAALNGGEDGLLFYRAILRKCKAQLKEGGFFLFEIGYDQANDIQGLAEEEGYQSCRIKKDLSGNDRVAYIA